MKNSIKYFIILLILPFMGYAQEGSETESETTEKKEVKLERATFESSHIIDNQTDVLLNKNALEVMFQHRFGLFETWEDFYGIWGQANIRLGASYGVHERVTIGVGTTKDFRYQDINWKVAILRQTRGDEMPVNLTYFGNFAYNAQKQETTLGTSRPITAHQDRYSYFHQLILSRRFSPEFSMQIAPSLSHFNIVSEGMQNDRFAIAIGARYKISPNTAILIDYSQPLTQFDVPEYDPEDVSTLVNFSNHPGFSLGFEFGTSGHAFQLYISNYKGIVPQENYMWNTNDFFGGDFLLGFNITRIYNF
jgi:hypothetical protein